MTAPREVPRAEVEELIPLLLAAEPSLPALRWSLGHLSDAVYRMDDASGAPVAAATMRWRTDPCEIVELAVAEAVRGRGFGKKMVAALVAEARRRGLGAMVVGTANASIGNIAFYQKCGFRMDSVRKDYFWYQRPPRTENGIVVRDLLMFRYELEPGETG